MTKIITAICGLTFIAVNKKIIHSNSTMHLRFGVPRVSRTLQCIYCFPPDSRTEIGANFRVEMFA
jgi:hypothetical protein